MKHVSKFLPVVAMLASSVVDVFGNVFNNVFNNVNQVYMAG